MKLRKYQEEAIKRIDEAMKTSHKLKVEISIGLGRNFIIAELLHIFMNKKYNVLVLTPNHNKCYQLRELFLNNEDGNSFDIALYMTDYVKQDILITTYRDFLANRNFNINNFNIVICDGIHYLNKKDITRTLKNKNIFFIGFTSMIDKKISGWFADATCVFRYTIQEAIQDGYSIKKYEIESIIFHIFQKQGYTVNIIAHESSVSYDLKVDKGTSHFAIEIKLWDDTSIRENILIKTANQLIQNAKKEHRIPILIIVNTIPQKFKNLLSTFDEIKLIDFPNLLFMTQNDLKLRDSLISVLNYSITDLQPIKPKIPWDSNIKDEETDISDLITAVESWDSQNKYWTEYEELCYKVLHKLFSNDLTLWKRQQFSNDQLFRFDLICKIKNRNTKEFWKIAEEYFKSKYIVFEFKSNKDQITQQEIFTTGKYLYSKALRSVAIIISANGMDQHAKKAIHGIFREEGKLIINLSNNDMIEMLKNKLDSTDPADILSTKLDEMLIDLEK